MFFEKRYARRSSFFELFEIFRNFKIKLLLKLYRWNNPQTKHLLPIYENQFFLSFAAYQRTILWTLTSANKLDGIKLSSKLNKWNIHLQNISLNCNFERPFTYMFEILQSILIIWISLWNQVRRFSKFWHCNNVIVPSYLHIP